MSRVKSILFVGVGGQGTILASKILSQGLLENGYDVKMSEVHGMAQRGGSVSTQVRFGDKVYSPLIEKGITKAHCLALLKNAGIESPRVYGFGFPNANCIPCCKATSPDYWAMVRHHFPVEFYRMAYLCRKFGARLTRIKGERIFIDQIPADWPMTNPIAPECDMLCYLAEREMACAI